MIARWKRVAAVALLLPMLTVFLSGCWDSRELDELFIVTGVALDKAVKDNQLDITLQVGKTQTIPSGSGDASSKENSMLLIKATEKTVMEGLMDIDRDSSRTLLLHHNQVLLFGSALAEQGVRDRLDLFLRNRETRMEELMMVTEGRAEELLATEMDQDKISGMFLWRVMNILSEMSPHYHVRLLDFVSRLLEETTAPIAPIVKLVRIAVYLVLYYAGRLEPCGSGESHKNNNFGENSYCGAAPHVRAGFKPGRSVRHQGGYAIQLTVCMHSVSYIG